MMEDVQKSVQKKRAQYHNDKNWVYKKVFVSAFTKKGVEEKLEEKKHYGELVIICEKQIKETPEWLTPYLYLGIALANLGYKDRAVDIFEYVKENSFGDPKYSQVSEFLEKLRSQ